MARLEQDLSLTPLSPSAGTGTISHTSTTTGTRRRIKESVLNQFHRPRAVTPSIWMSLIVEAGQQRSESQVETIFDIKY